jgi:perosamine synthetase
MTPYPKPHIPTMPVLSSASLISFEHQNIPSVLDVGNGRLVTSGRVAIALALQQMNIGLNDKVLIPSYHCSSMVEPVVVAGAEPIFYKINSDTSVNLDDIKSKIDSSTKLLMVTNYFGFPQDLSRIRSFCDAHHIMLLEDCAHSFFGSCDGKPLGSFGNYSIASAMKFFPIYDGGYLFSSRHSTAEITLSSAGPGFEIKSAINTFEKCFEYGRFHVLEKIMSFPILLKNGIWNAIKKKVPSGSISLGPGASDGGFEIEEKWLGKKSAFFSKCLIRHTNKARIVTNRRSNYCALQTGLEGLPGCHLLFKNLPAGVVPYVFPMLSDDPEQHFHLLRNAGVPVIRFGEFLWQSREACTCAVSADFSRRVMQFPCHQELTKSELDWMIVTIKKILLSTGSPQK